MMLLSIVFLALAAALAKQVLVHRKALQQRLDCIFKLFDMVERAWWEDMRD